MTSSPGGGRRSGSTPLHERIEQYLREQINELEAGERLPSESELSVHFSTTRMTVRAALQQLSAEGLIVRVAGSGTFVGHPRMHRQLGPLMSFSDEIRRRGKQPSSIVVDAGRRPSFERERRFLRLPSDSEVVEVRRLRLADGVPVAIQDTVLPPLFAYLLNSDLETRSLFEVLAEHGTIPVWSPGTLSAGLARGEEARLLHTAPNAPLLAESRVTYDQHGDPIELVESRYVGERLVLDVCLGFPPDGSPGRK
ncbi:MAG TPA: GntR family transcriptional regulator [Acidimicrobiales bacterium]|nr:GntR family transcriptional regulator [Acidimicrobiales bacterium]